MNWTRRKWEKRAWYRKYPLSNREEDNLVMDEIERCGKQDQPEDRYDEEEQGFYRPSNYYSDCLDMPEDYRD